MKTSIFKFGHLRKGIFCCFLLGLADAYGQSITTTSGSWFSASTWSNGAPGTTVSVSTRVVNPVSLDGSGGTINLMSSANINSIINAPITDISSGGWSVTFSNNMNNYLQINSTFYFKNNFDIAGGFPTTFAGNGYIGGTLSMQNNGGISLRIKSGYSVTVGGLNNQGGMIYIEPGASLIVIGNATIANNGTAGIITDGALVVNGSLSVQGGSGISGTGTLTTPNPITIFNNGGANVFGQTNGSTGGTIACSSISACNLSTNTVCSGVIINVGSSQSICSGATPASLTTIAGTSITGAVTYQWVQYSASTSSYQNVASGGTSATYVPGALTAQTFYKLKVTKAGCSTYSSAITISVSSAPVITNANITGTASLCTGNTALVYTINGITAGTSYTWTWPSGFVLVTTAGSFATVSISGSGTSGQISVSGVNACGTSAAVALNVSVNSIPVAGAISGSTAVCNGIYIYSIAPIANAASYTWTNTSASVTLTSGIATTTVTSSVTGGAFTNYVLSVSGTNSCGTGLASTITVTRNPTAPTGSGTIAGSSSVCPGQTSVNYTVSGYANVGAYTWTVPSGFTITSTNGTASSVITVSVSGSASAGNISVSGVGCGSTSVAARAITINSTPTGSGSITTPSICQGASGSLTASGFTNATTYNWVVSSGLTITSGQGTSSPGITTSGSAVIETITVTSSNACGNGTSAIANLTVNSVPVAPGPIAGSGSFCFVGAANVYSVPTVPGVTGYSWSVSPSGFLNYNITGPSNLNVVTITSALLSSGTVSVTATNACGTGPAASLGVSITVFSSLSSGNISGNTTICQNSMATYTVLNSAFVNNYTWVVPAGFVMVSQNGSASNLMTVSITGTTTGTLSVTGSSGCGSAPASTFDVTVYPLIAGTGIISGSSSVCPNSSSTYSITGLFNVSAYNWSVPSGFSISSGQSTSVLGVTVSGTASTGSLSISGSNTCGTGNIIVQSVNVNSTPTGTGAITGTNPVCLGAAYNYTVTGLINASSYNWTVPSGITISSGQGTSVLGITVATSSLGGNLSISGSNVCGSGNRSALTLLTNTTPGGTGVITGSSPVCQSTSANYTVTGISNLSSFNWSVPSGFTISSGQGTSVIGVAFSSSATTASISISGSNICGNGNRSTQSITVNATPSGTGVISGSSPVCQNTSANYTVTGISNLSSFNWSVPSGFTINSGQGTSVIGVTFSSSATTGSLSISGSNTCGSGNGSTQSITVNSTPAGTGVISGSSPVCQSSSASYTVTGVANASSFNWSVPSGFTINSGQGTSVLGVIFASNASSASLSFSGSNVCGSGLVAAQVITVTTVPSNPLTISGSLTVCQGQTSVIYNATVTNATSFNWGLPSGASIAAGTGTNSITVSYASSAASGILTVQGVNGSCIGNTSSAYNVTVNSSISSNTITGFAYTICTNTDPLTTLSGTLASGGSGSYTYVWQSSTISGSAGFSSAAGVNTNASYVPGTLGSTTWYRRLINSGTCITNTSSGVSINVVSLTGSWIGNTKDWNNSINWCAGTIPGNVYIDGGRPNYPVLSAAGAAMNDLTIASGASVTVNAPNNLTIGGNFFNSGTFTASTGTGVIFNGTSIQSISGANTFYDITVTKSATSVPVVLAGNTSLKGTLTLSANSNLVATGYSLVLVSDINNTARIASIPSTSTIAGNITMQRYIPAKLSFRFLSSAVLGSTLNDWKGNMFITGNGPGSDGGSLLPTVYQYNEPLAGSQNVGFQTITSGTASALQVGKGYRVFVRGNRLINLASNYSANITTLSVTGAPNIGQVSLPVTYTSTTGGNVSVDGWNLVGNPYASQIDWNLIKAGGANFQNIDDAIYMLDPISSSTTLAGQYMSYVGGVAAGPGSGSANPNLISSSQAFFVHANALNPVLKVDENVKTGSTVNNHFREEEIPNLLRITIDGTSGSDNTAIRFAEGATDNFDSNFDAYKIQNTNASISSNPVAGLDLSINSMLPLSVTSKTIPLNISTPVNGNQQLTFSNLPSFGTMIKAILVDKYLNTNTEIEEGSVYPFATSTIPGTKGNTRFEIVFEPQLGSVNVTMSPDSLMLVNTNVKWSLDTSGYANKETAMYIPAGTHTITFATIPGWITPAPQQITVVINTIITVSGQYLRIPRIGSLKVTLTPESLDKGRIKTQWRINDGAWQNSGTKLDSLPEGNYTISFNDLNGWVKPGEMQVSIQNGLITTFAGAYIEIEDTTVAPIPQTPEVTLVKTDTVATTNVPSDSLTSVKNPVNEMKWSVYPNPAGAESPVISINGLRPGDFSIAIYNQSGVLVYTKLFSQSSTLVLFQTRLEIFKELPEGIYLVQLTQANAVSVKKVKK